MKKMRKFLLSFLILTMAFVGMIQPVSAEEDVPELTEGIYTYIVESGGATIIECERNVSGFIAVPETMGGYPVTGIGDHAFWLCEEITGFSLPNTIVSIGIDSFEHTAFYDNPSNWENHTLYLGKYLIRVEEEYSGAFTVREGTELIAGGAFGRCKLITGLSLPEGLRYIGENAFSWNVLLEEVQIPSMEDWLAISFEDENANPLGEGRDIEDLKLVVGGEEVTDIVIPEGTTKIGKYSFCYPAMTSATIPATVQEIGAGAFRGNHRFEKVVIEDLMAWCSIAFEDETANPISGNGGELYLGEEEITHLAIPQGTTAIGAYAFYNYGYLNSVNIPESVTSIGEYAFTKCYSLDALVVDSENPAYASENNVLFNKEKTVLIQAGQEIDGVYEVPDTVITIEEYAFCNVNFLKSVTIPDSVKEIGNNAFDGCHSLKIISMGNGITTIGDNAFQHCEVKSIKIPDSTKIIGDGAFNGCDELESVTIGKGVERVGEDAFYRCRKVKRLKFYSGVTEIGDRAFSGCDALTCLILPGTIKQIGSGLVDDCNDLEVIYFCGTEDRWNEISIDEDNEGLAEKTIVFVPEKSTRTRVSDDKKTLSVNVFHYDDEGTVLLGLYKGKQLVELQYCSYVDEELVFETTVDYDTVRVMLWDDLSGLAPMMGQEILQIS